MDVGGRSQAGVAGFAGDQPPVRSAAVSAEVGAGAASEEPASARSRRSAGRAPPIRSARSACARRAPASSPASRPIRDAAQRARRRDQGRRSSSATARSSSRRRARSTARSSTRSRSIRRSCERIESLFPGRDFDAVTDKLHNHGIVVDQARPRRGAHDRPHQPLQHDVRPVLHGRQPGRLRPRADAGRRQAAARRRDQHQAAAADDDPVLRRRADHLADLPRRRPLRARGRLLQRAGRDQRHPLRAGAGVRPRGARRRAAHRLSAVRRRHRRRPTPTARSATCSTSSCAPSRICTPPASTSAWS